jgi:RHS repeat-associated protein
MIQSASSASTNFPDWGDTFTIDPWGNLTNIGPVAGRDNQETLNAAPATVQNRLTGFGYDAAGNLTSNGTTIRYDAENRIFPASGTTYSYDGSGHRVQKSSGKLYWYGAGDDVLSETSLTGTPVADYIFFNGKRIARVDQPSGNKHFYVTDHLGSTILITNNVGSPQEDSDFYPYGKEIPILDGDPNAYKFTGKERDSDGNDYFGARYYESSMGRFMSPDWSNILSPVPYASVDDPQTLNLYSYVRNNPTTLIDPDGHCWNGFQHLCNLVSGYGWRSDAQVEQAVHDAREWLRENTSFSSAQQEGLNGKQALALYKGFQNHDKSVVSDGKRWTLQIVSMLPGVVPPKLYRGGTNMQGRPNIDLRIDKGTGLVKPGRGISLNENPGNLEQFGGANEIDQSSVPPELEIVQTNKPGHYELAPRGPMTVERYNELAGQVTFK